MTKDEERLTLNYERLARIEQIAQQLEDLTSELNRLLIEEAFIQRPNEVVVTATQPREFAEHQRVQITNNYRGQLNARGTVTDVTPHWVWVRIDGHRFPVRKRHHNLIIIAEAPSSPSQERDSLS